MSPVLIVVEKVFLTVAGSHFSHDQSQNDRPFRLGVN